jgi:hypothetical protein
LGEITEHELAAGKGSESAWNVWASKPFNHDIATEDKDLKRLRRLISINKYHRFTEIDGMPREAFPISIKRSFFFDSEIIFQNQKLAAFS